MKLYSHYGINDFIICCGYEPDDQEYFLVMQWDVRYHNKHERNGCKSEVKKI